MKLLLPFAVLASATPAFAQTDYSAQIATTGLAATTATLAALPDPTPSDRFALGGTLFLSAIERALQTRYRTGLSGSLTMMADLPILRLPIPENPNPEAFDPAMVEVVFRDIRDDLVQSLVALAPITDTDQVAVTINTADIWFDINMNSARDTGENFADVVGLVVTGGFGPPPPDLTIRFDTADAAWLSAYAHLLSGISETILAFSPTGSIARVLDATAAMQALAPRQPDPYGMGEFGDVADMIAIVVGALEQQPDPENTRAAHAHFLGMIGDNRTFWARVATETDNELEWIPNKKQQSVLPIAFPADTGARWQAVLADAEALLNGDLLIPHWRLGQGAGVNLARLFQDPPEVDIVGFVQGGALLPYMEQGRLISSQSLMMFDQLVQGDAGLYMVVLN